MIPKINNIAKPIIMNNAPHNMAKKVIIPVAGLTGLTVLSGAWPGPSTPPPGAHYPKDSVDDGIFESLVDKLQRTGNLIIEDTKMEAPIKDFIAHAHDTYDHFVEGAKEFGQSIIDACSEQL